MAQYQGVIVMTMNDVPLGFGAAAKSTGEIRKDGALNFQFLTISVYTVTVLFLKGYKYETPLFEADPMNIIAFHQADIGEYIRSEDTLL